MFICGLQYADQTPTPTRFIRNCEEVGLFQDLQNVNPFEETFRKAVEAAKTGAGPLHEELKAISHEQRDDFAVHMQVLLEENENPIMSDEALFFFASTAENLNADDSKSQRERQELDQLLHPTSTTGDDNCTTEIVTSSILEKTKVVINSNNIKVVGIENNAKVVRQEADTSQHQVAAHGKAKQIINGDLGNKQGESNVNAETTSVVSPGSSTVQLLLRMPDGKLLQLQALPVEQLSSSETNTVESLPQPSQNTAVVLTAQQLPGAVAESNLNKPSARSSVAPVKHPSGISMAKMKLKQTLTSTKRILPETSDPSAKLPITKTLPANGKNEPQHISKLARNAIAKQSSSSSSSSNSEDPGEKRQKFLARNREKRKTWIQELERRAEDMQRTNHNLQSEVAALRSEVASLKTLLLAHKD
ncbi:Cyclic AMP-dependent transcription factor ATF-2 [Blattella germanica]|nr:Cyclic AMP-dependent transcription factor ATF-2 [Blattella germanica]